MFQPRFMATSLATMAQRDAADVCAITLANFPEAPAVPRLSKTVRMFLESLPCLTIDSERGKLIFDLSGGRESELVDFYEHIISEDLDYFAITEKAAPGAYRFLRILQQAPPPHLKVVHIQTPGPVSLALGSLDQTGNPGFYNETVRDIIVKHMAMKARWQEKWVREALPQVQTLVSYGEPALVLHTSAFSSGTREEIIAALDEVIEAVEGIAGVHCCANIDWSILLDSKAAWINFDAFEHAGMLALYPDHLQKFMDRGGMLGWGVVPTFDEKVAVETTDSLVERLEAGLEGMAARGLSRELLAETAWVTPSCTTASMSPEMSTRALELTGTVSKAMRRRYFA